MENGVVDDAGSFVLWVLVDSSVVSGDGYGVFVYGR